MPKDRNQKEPIHLASSKGHRDVVQYLVKELQCNPDVQDGYGSTALHLAAKEGHMDTVQYLVESGAQLDTKDNKKRTPKDVAKTKKICEFLEHKETQKSLESEDSCKKPKSHRTGPCEVHVFKQTSFEINKNSCTFDWQGIKIEVQANSLPDDVDNCFVDVCASVYGSYQFPDCHYQMSPVYWFQCTPNIDIFKHDLKLGITHCAKDPQKLCLARADNEPDGKVYKFTNVKENPLPGSDKYYAHFEIKGFCAYCLISKSGKRLYDIGYFYRKGVEDQQEKNIMIDLVMVPTSTKDVFKKELEEQYRFKYFTVGHWLSSVKENDSNTIDTSIGMNGVDVDRNWKLVPQQTAKFEIPDSCEVPTPTINFVATTQTGSLPFKYTLELTSDAERDRNKLTIDVRSLPESDTSQYQRKPTSWDFWGLSKVNTIRHGKGISIAILDTGIRNHKAFLPMGDSSEPKFSKVCQDQAIDHDSGNTPEIVHGSYVAGVAAGRHMKYEIEGGRGEAEIHMGVAEGATLRISKVAETTKTKYDIGSIIETLEEIKRHNDSIINGRSSQNRIQIVVMGFQIGKTGRNKTQREAIEALIKDLQTKQNVVCIVAPGNSGVVGYSGFPANLDTVLTVGAVDRFGHLSKLSVCDRHVDVYALGEDVCVPTFGGNAQLPNCVNYKSGTSFSAPAVAGLVALLINEYPGSMDDGRQITNLKILKGLFEEFMVEETIRGIKVLHPVKVRRFFRNRKYRSIKELVEYIEKQKTPEESYIQKLEQLLKAKHIALPPR